MRYGIIMSSVAESEFEQFDPEFKSLIGNHLLDLADNPGKMSRDSVCPPHPPGYRIFEFEHRSLGEHHWFSILFNVDSNRNSILVAGIGHIEYETSMDWSPPDGM